MYKIYCTLLFLFVFLCSMAQVNIGNGRGTGNLWVSNHGQKTFAHLKTKKTLFIIPNVCNKSELESVIKSIWTFNEIKFVDSKDFLPNKVNYFAKEQIQIYLRDMDFVVSKGIETRGYFKKLIFLASIYENLKFDRKGNLKKADYLDIAEIYLSNKVVYEQQGEDIYCLELGLIKNYFQELNRRLENSKNLKMKDGIVKKEKLAILSNKPLHIPWAVKNDADSKEIEDHEEFIAKTLKKYEHPYKLVSYNELNDQILRKEEFYYLNTTQFSKFKILSISNSKTGEIIYLNVESRYKVKASDLSKVSNIISKPL